MQVKKHPHADLDRYSGLYFVIGLTIVLFITWRALEYKSYDTKVRDVVIAYNEEPVLREEAPVTEALKLPPPPVMLSAPAVIEIVDDVEEVEETVISSTEINQETEVGDYVLEVEEVVVEEVEEDITVPFAVIEDVPVFPGCEGGDNESRKACFQQKIQELFGLAETPTVARGRVRVLLHLLAPNGRPQQVTDDLASFWADAYHVVRKDLRARYPRHGWPEDPTTAPPPARPGRPR